MRTTTSTLNILVLLLALVAADALGAQSQTTTQPPAEAQVQDLPRPRTPPTQPDVPPPARSAADKRWQPYLAFGSVFDTNIDHNQQGVDSLGGVLGLGLRYRNDPADPSVEITGEVAGHSYTNSSRWDRISEKLVAAFERDLPGRWSFDTTGEISLKGSSEDREISDQYLIEPRIGFRLGPRTRVRAYAAARARRYEDDRDRNAFNRYVGIEFTERPAEDRRWDVDLRYEVNDTRGPRNHYVRWTFGTGYAFPVTAEDTIELEARYRMQRYPYRMVDVDDEDHPRRDHRWIPRVTWTRPLKSNLDLRAVYTLETRTSNDPDREFTAHLFSLGVVRRW